MKVFDNLEQWRAFRSHLTPEITLGFVPTMGNLHAGHISLINASQQENTHTIVSLFINPTQFNNQADFINYPRTLDNDLQLLKTENVDYCLLPTEASIYHDAYRYQIQENQLTQIMEGQYRPGHFTGVLTIVMKLLNLVRPHHAYFGEKDYQQYLLIREMAAAFFLETQIKACPTIREKSGLAYSSRNNRLSPAERAQAEQFAQVFHQDNTSSTIKNNLEKLGVQLEYLEEYAGRRFDAVYIGAIRLIDNYSIQD